VVKHVDNLPFDTYLSPYTWRYGSEEMRRIWSELEKRRLWRDVWVALAEVQAEFGLLRPEQVEDVRRHAGEVDVARSLEIEAEIHHDLMAELRVFAEQSTSGGGSLHLGATSMDIEDNADALRIRQSLDVVLVKLTRLLGRFAAQIDRWADTPIIAFTHLQPAEPSTLGYRLALYAQDLLSDWEDLRRVRRKLRGKGFKGAVGTAASFGDLIGIDKLAEFELRLSTRLGLPFYPVSGQTYPRKQDYQVLSALADLGASVYKFAFDLRFLQSPPVGELSEPFGKKQVGSSAMPFKRNPINAEKINSLARQLAQAPMLAWQNAAHSLLERTLDDSANRRTLLPEAFLCTDELLQVTLRIVDDLQVDEQAMARNLQTYAPFAASERVLMALARKGADRQAMHERLRLHSMQAWEAVRQGHPNPLVELLANDRALGEYLQASEIHAVMVAGAHLGDAPQRARGLAAVIRQAIGVQSEE
jgi:adenylosuccinate lyase